MRTMIISKPEGPRSFLVLIILMYGVNVTSGYFAMLVAMTYSVELFSCMILGLVLGHALFNSGPVVPAHPS